MFVCLGVGQGFGRRRTRGWQAGLVSIKSTRGGGFPRGGGGAGPGREDVCGEGGELNIFWAEFPCPI